MELSTLGMRIRHYRQKIGISQRELAAAVGMSSNAVSCYEKGTREPNIATLAAFAGILQITGDTLLGLKPNPFSGAQNGKELSMLHTFRDLNETGQDKALEYIRDLSQLNVYAANNNPDTTRHDTTRHDTTRHDTTRHDTTRHICLLCKIVFYTENSGKYENSREKQTPLSRRRCVSHNIYYVKYFF